MTWDTACKALELLLKNCRQNPTINFFGGEPFLEFDLLSNFVDYAGQKCKRKGLVPRFITTTNGTLFDQRRLEFIVGHQIEVNFSIDGMRHVQEMGKGQGSYDPVRRVIEELCQSHSYPVKTITVVTPDNVPFLADSVKSLVSMGAEELEINPQYDREWNESALRTLEQNYKTVLDYLLEKKSQGVRLLFHEQKPKWIGSAFQCTAATDGFTVTPVGELYGCPMHIPWSRRAAQLSTLDHFSGLCLGNIHDITPKEFHRRTKRLRSDIRLCSQLHRYTAKQSCIHCRFIVQCMMCPVVSLIFCQDPMRIPDWCCEINKAIFRAGKACWKKERSGPVLQSI